jgi:hypothetical protein
LLIALRKGNLSTIGSSNDVHPIDALRIYLAADVIRDTKELDANVANEWADTFGDIADKYITNLTTKQFGPEQIRFLRISKNQRCTMAPMMA